MAPNWFGSAFVITDLEIQKFLQYSRGGIEQRFINMQGILPTCLHSAGNQIYACKCGCRGPLSDKRLQERGLFGTLIPMDPSDGKSTVCRYLHPKEMYILNGGNPLMQFDDLRLGLAAVGQCVSPFHGVWMLSHIASHLANFLQHDAIDPQYCLHQYVKGLLDQRDQCWPPMHAHQLIPTREDPRCMQVPNARESTFHGDDFVEVSVGDEHTQSVIAFRALPSVTVQQFVDAQSKLQGTSVEWPCVEDRFEQAPADMEVCNNDLVLRQHALIDRTDKLLPCPCEEEAITPTVPMKLEPLFEQSHMPVDALTQLQGADFLTIVGPQVTHESVDALVESKISSDARQLILAHQDMHWADDEIRVFLKQIVSKGPLDQNLCSWDPLLMTSMSKSGNFTSLAPLADALDAQATVISAVVINKHWCPIVWRVDAQGILGFTCGLDFTHSMALQRLHNEFCRLKQVQPTMIVNRSLAFALVSGCGAMAIAFIEHLIWGHPLPNDVAAVQAKHVAFRAMYRDGLTTPAPRPWIWGAGVEDVKDALASLLKGHGVAHVDCSDRIQMLITKLGTQPIERALKTDQPWRELKWLANKVVPVVQIIRPSELQAMIEARAGHDKPIGNRTQKQTKAKGKGKGKSSADSRFQVDPSKVRLEKGIFVCGDGIQLSQIDVSQVGAQASGVVVCSATEAAPYLKGNCQISTGGLAFVVLTTQEFLPPTALISEQVRIPVLCAANAEPLLVDAFLFQLGAVPVRRHLAEDRFELTSVSSCVAKIAVYRDQCDRSWDSFVVHPLRHIFSKEPCEDEVCGGGCENWHKSHSCSIDHPILEMWGKQWMMINFVGATPEKAEVFTVHVRVPLCIQLQLQTYSGCDGIFIEPKALDGRRPSEMFQVIWMAKTTIQDLRLLKQTQENVCGLARMGNKMGIRCLAIHAAALYEVAKPGSAFLPHGRKRFFLMGPVPFGTLKSSISEAVKTINWVARPVSPIAAAPHIQGVMWKLQAVESPSKTVLQLAHGEVVITCMEQPQVLQPVRSQVVGADRTVQMCTAKEAGAIDQLQLHDPWASAIKMPKTGELIAKNDNQDPVEQIEQRVMKAVLANLPRESMEVDSTSQSVVVDQKLAELENKVHMLHDGHQRLHQAVQEQTAAQARLETRVGEGAEQLQTFQTQFRAQLEQQQGQLDSLFQQQMSRIEEILKRPRREWRGPANCNPLTDGWDMCFQGVSWGCLIVGMVFLMGLSILTLAWLWFCRGFVDLCACFACWSSRDGEYEHGFDESRPKLRCVGAGSRVVQPTGGCHRKFSPSFCGDNGKGGFWFLMVFLFGMLRIGEARHPGPEATSEWHFGIFNTSGLCSKTDMIAFQPGDIWVASETHLTRSGVVKLRTGLKALRSQYQYVVPGAPCVQRSSADVGIYSGVAMISAYPARPLPHDFCQNSFLSSRIQVAGVNVAGQWIHVGMVYGVPKGKTHCQALYQTEVLLEQVIDRVGCQVDGPRIVCGDFNFPEECLYQTKRLLDLGFVEVQTYALKKWGVTEVPTGKGSKKLDQVWISRELQSQLIGVTVEHDWWPDHAIVQCRFSSSHCDEPSQHWPMPKKFPWPTDWHSDITFDRQLPVTEAYAKLWIDIETQAEAKVVADGSYVPYPAKGRAQTLVPVQTKGYHSPCKLGRHGDLNPEFHGVSLKHARWFKQLRRLQAIARLSKHPVNGRQHEHVLSLWNAIRQAPGFYGGFCQWWKITFGNTPCSDGLSWFVPQHGDLQQMFDLFHQHVRDFEQHLIRDRIRNAKDCRRQDLHLVFKDCGREAPLAIDSLVKVVTGEVEEVRHDDSSIVFTKPFELLPECPIICQGKPMELIMHSHDQIWVENVEGVQPGDTLSQEHALTSNSQILQALAQVWRDRWIRLDHVRPGQWQQIVSFIQEKFHPIEWDFPPISCAQFVKNVERKKRRAATGADGISKTDLLQLPSTAIQAHVELLQEVEASSHWPDQLCTGFVASLDKNKGQTDVDAYRPITVFPMLYRIWSSIRSGQSLRCISRVLPQSVYGGIPGKQAREVWYTMSQLIELAHADQQPLFGIVMDIRRAFNALPREPIWMLLKQLSYPDALLKTWAAFVSKQVRRFKVRNSIGEAVSSCTGLPEGCGMSVFGMVLIDYLLDVWLQCMVPGPHRVFSFVDDWQVAFADVVQLPQIWRAVVEFTRVLDLDLDLHKSFAWAARTVDRPALHEHSLQTSLASRILGAHQNFCCRPGNRTLVDRVEGMSNVWKKLKSSFAPLKAKILAIRQLSWPRALHGIAAVHLGKSHFGHLRTGAMQGLRASRVGASPVLHLTSWSPLTDPEFWAIV